MDGREPGPGGLGVQGALDVQGGLGVQGGAWGLGLTVWVRGGSAQVLLSGFCKESPPVPLGHFLPHW